MPELRHLGPSFNLFSYNSTAPDLYYGREGFPSAGAMIIKLRAIASVP